MSHYKTAYQFILTLGARIILVCLDDKDGNVVKCKRRQECPGDIPNSLTKIVLTATSFPTHLGGLYRGALRRDLLRDEREPLGPINSTETY